MSKETLAYKNKTVDYSLIRGDRKTTSIVVNTNGYIEVYAPSSLDKGLIEKFIKRKDGWINKQVSFFDKFSNEKSVKQYVSGESFLYLGRQYKLIVDKAGLKQDVKLSKGILKVSSHNTKDQALTKELLLKWYSYKRDKVFLECLNKSLERFPNYNNDFKIVSRKMTKRWGSYLKKGNKIILNDALIKAPKEAIIYVITHELCHFKHNNHSRDFYDLLDSKMPNWKQIKEKLELRFSD